MPKKSSKKSKQVAEGPVVQDEKKPSTTPKKSVDEIDEIFAGKKRKKADNEKAKKAAGDVDASKLDDKVKKSKKKQKRDSKKSGADKQNGNDFADPPSRSRKRTGDGLALFTEEELGIGKADAGASFRQTLPIDCNLRLPIYCAHLSCIFSSPFVVYLLLSRGCQVHIVNQHQLQLLKTSYNQVVELDKEELDIGKEGEDDETIASKNSRKLTSKSWDDSGESTAMAKVKDGLIWSHLMSSSIISL